MAVTCCAEILYEATGRWIMKVSRWWQATPPFERRRGFQGDL